MGLPSGQAWGEAEGLNPQERHGRRGGCRRRAWVSEKPVDPRPACYSHPRLLRAPRGTTSGWVRCLPSGWSRQVFYQMFHVIMLELRSFHYFAPKQKTLFPVYRIGVMFENNWLVFKTEDCRDCLS